MQKLVLFHAVTCSFISIHSLRKNAFLFVACCSWSARCASKAPPVCSSFSTMSRTDAAQQFPGCSSCAPSKLVTKEKYYNYRHSPCFVPFPVLTKLFLSFHWFSHAGIFVRSGQTLYVSLAGLYTFYVPCLLSPFSLM